MKSKYSKLKSVAEQWITLWCTPVDWELFDRLHTEKFEDCSSAGRPSTKQGFADGLAELVRAFPDLQTIVTGLVIDESTSQVAVRWAAKGTNKSRFLSSGPTNRVTSITGIELIEVQGDQIVRRWGEWDISAHTERV